jgi:hypothetical protein
MATGFTPQGTNPFDAQRVARSRIPKRYPVVGFAIIGVYFVLTIVVVVIRGGADLHEPMSDLAPPTPPGFEGVAPELVRPSQALDEIGAEQRVPPPAFNDARSNRPRRDQEKPHE